MAYMSSRVVDLLLSLSPWLDCLRAVMEIEPDCTVFVFTLGGDAQRLLTMVFERHVLKSSSLEA